MSPLPERLIDRWRAGSRASRANQGMLYWHVLLGDTPQVRAAAQAAQSRIEDFPGLHMTPLQWLHLTVLMVGPADQIPQDAGAEMLASAQTYLAKTAPITIELGRILYHPEAIMLAAQPTEALKPIREAAERATCAVMGKNGHDEESSPRWVPHVTLCYSTSMQPAGPIIAALGRKIPNCKVSVDTLSLVLQSGAEWLWNWSPVGSVALPSDLQARARYR